MKTRFLWIVTAALLFGLTPGWAVPLQATVTYVSPTAIYLDAGSAQGIQKGDSGEVRHADAVIARLEVEFVAEHSASCRLMEGAGAVQVGDRAVLQVTPPAVVPVDTAAHAASPVAPAPAPTPERQPPKPKMNRVSGRISIQAVAQNDLAPSNQDFVEPAGVLRLHVDNLGGTMHTLSINLRSLKEDRQFGTRRTWTHRLYEFALYYQNPESPVAYSAGRILSNRMSGIGYLDGATFEYRTSPFWSLGVFGGAQPDLQTYAFERKQTKAGIYAAYDRGSYTTSHLAGTLALAGNYLSGNISREFGYEQLSYSVQKLFLYQSAEVNINRGWRRTAEGSTFKLSDVLLNAHYSPLHWLSTNLSYDNRTNFRTYETRFTPDSVFDHALRQGWRIGANARLAVRWYLLGEAGLRTRQNQGTETRSFSGGAGGYNLFGSGFQLDARVTTFRGHFTEGYQPTVSVAREIIQQVRAEVEVGMNRYTIEQSKNTINNRWVRLNTDWNISRNVYGSAYGELDRGDGNDANRGFVEIGYRF